MDSAGVAVRLVVSGYASGKVVSRILIAAVLLLTMLALNACQRSSGDLAYSLPEQRPTFFDPEAERETRVLMMTDIDAKDHFVRDIGDKLEGSWRWCTKRPTVRLQPASSDANYFIDFSIPEATFTQTGPVTVTFLVNDRVLAKQRYNAAGRYKFEQKVPADWIRIEGDTTVAAEIDKVFHSAQDQRDYGFILVSLGLSKIEAAPGTLPRDGAAK
jgi:hypothetical protein